jgi:predicted nucleic acid-binding Zn ribbon protein
MSHAAPHPFCSVCSKAIRSGMLVLYEDGQLFHLACRSRELRLHAMEGVADAQALRAHAATLLSDSTVGPRHPRPSRKSHSACPFCGRAATVTDWRPSVPWLAVEGCPCEGFFLWTGLTQGRLTKLSRDARGRVALQIRGIRASGREAWCTTDDGTPAGSLVVRGERPDQAT